MDERSESKLAIWLVCIGIGLLFLVRGAFQPYVFPLFENLEGLSYTQIALLLNGYVLAQSICAPVAGWFTDRTSVKLALSTSIVIGLSSFLLISTKPGFAVSTMAVFLAGLGFVLGKIALNTVLVLQSSAETLRRSVAKRATLLNLGSFLGNSIAYQVTTRLGYTYHVVLLGLLHLPLAIGFAAPVPPSRPTSRQAWDISGIRVLARNKKFLADSLRRFAIVLPYGCWGTIIPKYVIDQYHSSEKIWIIYLTSLCTTIVGAHFLAAFVSERAYQRGFKWEWWSMVSVLFYCTGLLLLVFASRPMLLPVAVVVFICGEVVMTPCFDETAKMHSADAGMATCLGLLHLVDGFGRMLGAAFALAVYGWMRNSPYHGFYWPLVAAVFFISCSLLHIVAYALAREQGRIGVSPVDNADKTPVKVLPP